MTGAKTRTTAKRRAHPAPAVLPDVPVGADAPRTMTAEQRLRRARHMAAVFRQAAAGMCGGVGELVGFAEGAEELASLIMADIAAAEAVVDNQMAPAPDVEVR